MNIRVRATIACLLAAIAACSLCACGTKGPLYLPKGEPAAKPMPPVPLPEPVPVTTNKPGQ